MTKITPTRPEQFTPVGYTSRTNSTIVRPDHFMKQCIQAVLSGSVCYSSAVCRASGLILNTEKSGSGKYLKYLVT